MKRLVLKLLLFVPLFGTIIVINWLVDPAHLFDSESYLNRAADALVSGHNMANLTDYDERLLQKQIITHKNFRCPKVTVIGSSRTLQIKANLFENADLLNNSVSGAVLQDILAIYRLYDIRGCKMEKLVLGIDPWMFDHNRGDPRSATLQAEANEMLIYLGFAAAVQQNQAERLLTAKLKELISFDYFKVSVKNWRRKPFVTKQNRTDLPIKFVDGTIHEFGYAQRTQQEIDRFAAEYNYEDFNSFKEIDPNAIIMLGKLIDHIQAKGIEITIFISPYHPITWQNIISKHPIYADFRTSLLRLERKFNIRQYGDLNPHAFGLTNSDFYDGMHLKPQATGKIFQSRMK